mmetsp:Transcript_2756/g.4160  ORF Transcript_2756/g.4160 Transcript_2756/m.4160 type:complete len:88 (+) Transcript_2756:2-265(+)|eukprot:CAMPEP_0197248066 /NCGR_PEP_ID=MMETSP1429-20130617/32654_1 /TAXON_ID=49237 /ORGANISM="Chaetoceros  sp., Strain UNC1202" /LENGTH=87 /DNA_ID=CAMNT_0042709141 /DNA_START=1 /DNA_END=264 /DNA_ORIENTATION=+
MDLEKIQAAKIEFAETQDPPIAPCTNTGCGFTKCTCETKCGCHIKKEDLASQEGDLRHCDPCAEFKLEKKRQKEAMEKQQDSCGCKD